MLVAVLNRRLSFCDRAVRWIRESSWWIDVEIELGEVEAERSGGNGTRGLGRGRQWTEWS